MSTVSPIVNSAGNREAAFQYTAGHFAFPASRSSFRWLRSRRPINSQWKTFKPRERNASGGFALSERLEQIHDPHQVGCKVRQRNLRVNCDDLFPLNWRQLLHAGEE